MATDFNENAIVSSGGFKPSSKDTPLDIRTRVETESDILDIPNPYIGMVIYVEDTKKRFEVLTLKEVDANLVTESRVDTYQEFTVNLSADSIEETDSKKFVSNEQITKWNGIDNLSADSIKETDSKKFVSNEQIAKWDSMNNLSKSENTKYSTENGVKEFSCKDGYVDNVTIEGETLVNLATPESFTTTTSTTTYFIWHIKCQDMTLNKTVTIFNFSDKVLRIDVRTGNSSSSTFVRAEKVNANSSKVLSLSETEFIQNFNGALTDGWSESDESNLKVSCVILEGDHTDKPISYFEGLKSVGQGDKIEVVSYKKDSNLFDNCSYIFNTAIESTTGEVVPYNSGWKISQPIKLKSNTEYTFSKKDLDGQSVYVFLYNNNKIEPSSYCYFWVELNDTKLSEQFTTFNSPQYGVIVAPMMYDSKVSIVEGNSNKYTDNYNIDKKQISTTLRSLPNGVKDTIEKRGNKYVKVQRCGEVTLNGSEQLKMNANNGNTAVFGVIHAGQTHKRGLGICDKLRYHMLYNTGEEHFYLETDNAVNIEISLSKLSSANEEGLKTWLASNPITIVYELETPIITELPNFNPQTYEGDTTLLLNTGAIQGECEFEVTNSVGSEIEVIKDKLNDIYNYVDRELVSEANKLKNILISKNVEVAASENKLSILIQKVNELEVATPPLYLYNEGDECIDITGGWVNTNPTTGATLTKDLDKMNLKVVGTSGTQHNCFADSKNLINLSNYTSLYIEYDTNYPAAMAMGAVFGVGNSKGAFPQLANAREFASSTKKVIMLDISSITEGYIVNRISTRIDEPVTLECNIYRIWLEK